MAPVRTTSRPLVAMAEMLDWLRDRMGRLGLNLSVRDVHTRIFEGLGTFPQCEFCGAMGGCGDLCNLAAAELAGRVAAEDGPSLGSSPTGCRMLAVAIRQRHRHIGSVVACYPTAEMLEEESFARLCGRLEVDRPSAAAAVAPLCRHSANEAEDLLRMLEWMLESAQTVRSSRHELATLSANLSSTYEELSLLYRISGAMNVAQQPIAFLENICNELLEAMSLQAAVAFVDSHASMGDEDAMVAAGNCQLDDRQIKRLVEHERRSAPSQAGEAIVHNNFHGGDDGDIPASLRNLIAMPLVSENEPIGMLMGMNKCDGEFSTVDLKLITSIGNQSAIFLTNSRLYADLQDLLMGVLHALTASIDAKDPYTCGHSQRVAMISKMLAEDMDLPPEKVEYIYLAGLLHDIGKIGVPEYVLCKDGKLTNDEYELIKRHPGIGAKILGGIRQLDNIVTGILTHHERPDGKGYPQGLAGENVPIEGLIIGLADSFDAMTSDRTYRSKLPVKDVIKEIQDNVDTQFGRQVVERLLARNMEEFLCQLYDTARTVFPLKAEVAAD